MAPLQKNVSSVLLLFALTAISFSCNKHNASSKTSMNNSNTYLALGDSYTIGEAVAVQDRFPVQARRLANAAGKMLEGPQIVAVTGWTTGDLLAALATEKPANNYAYVTLLIGVNNQYRGYDTAEYRQEFITLLNKAVGYAGGVKKHVCVLSIPDYSVTPFAANSDTQRIAREIDLFNAINKQETLKAGVNYVDITPISRQAKTDPALIAGDGLHPSGKQYAQWAALLAPVIINNL